MSDPISKSNLPLVAETTSFWYPLDVCYQRQGLPLPQLEKVNPDQVPEPFHRLIVHENDMTPTLEAFYRDSIYIELLHRDYSETHYFREVVLKLEADHRPVEFGAIRIFLERMPEDARKAILNEHLPLGHILESFKVEHISRPIGFLRMVPDELIVRAFGDPEHHWLYGRRNRLSTPAGESLAEIIEILPDSRIAHPSKPS